MQKPRVLVIDDEKNIRRTLSMILKGEGFQVAEAETGEDGLAMATEKLFELVILDVNLPGEDGLQILPKLKKVSPRTSVLMVSGQATVQIAVDATRAGAFDFIEKPLSKDRVLIALRNALRLSQLDLQVSAMQDEESMRYQLVGDSKGLNSVRRQIDKVGPTPATVLVTGESGTGKELVARAIHGASSRKDKAFIKVNCAAIPEELIETELFGCVKGAYTGADRDRDGKFTAADGGTIFLDEIGDMSLKVQAKVLRALQEGEIERVGDTEPMHVDVRVIAATNKDLMKEVQGERFREDLFYRLNVIPIVVPPLRERREDIPSLCEHFLTRYAVENDLPRMELSKKATQALSEMPWQGNIRELRNVMERLAILSDGPAIEAGDVELIAPMAAVPQAMNGSTYDPEAVKAAGGLVAARRDFEKRCIEACLDKTKGNVSQAARWLGIERSNLHKKMQALGLEARPARDAS